MQKKEDIWYRIGFALESARQKGVTSLPSSGGDGRGTGTDRKKLVPVRQRENPRALDEASKKLLEAILTVGAGTFLTRILSLWPGRRKPGLFRLGKAGAAGAAAAFLASLVGPILSREGESGGDDDLANLLLSGAGRGLLYAAIVEPRVPGPGLLQGGVYGVLEWALVPWGGLEELAGPAAPQGKIPVLATLLRGTEEEEQLLEHLVFGMALALLYQD